MSASLYGRRMYELMAASWPMVETEPSSTPAMREFARWWVDSPKIVFSSSLHHVAWNSRLVRNDAPPEVARLKSDPGFEMDVGGPTLAASLIAAGRVDELRAFVHPVVLGAGKPFLPPLDHRIQLNLLETRTFSSSVVYMRSEIENPGT